MGIIYDICVCVLFFFLLKELQTLISLKEIKVGGNNENKAAHCSEQ